MLKSLFNFPYYQTNIPSYLYNKEELICNMVHNYRKDSSRNQWNPNCDLHHEYNDRDNEDYIKIDYEKLIPIYNKVVEDFISQISFCKNIKWNYEIVNYTVTTNTQNMWPHHHIPSTFSAVHYIKFNPSVHKSSVFVNPSHYNQIFDLHYHDLVDCLDPNNDDNMWIFGNRTVSVKEDDIVITPSIVDHAITRSNSDEERITIVLNINILKDD